MFRPLAHTRAHSKRHTCSILYADRCDLFLCHERSGENENMLLPSISLLLERV